MQNLVKKFVQNQKFQTFIIVLIVINGITMGLETSKDFMQSYGSFIDAFDVFVITVYTIEIILRIYAHRLEFFKDGWSIFDFLIVGVSLIPASAGFEIFRILRVLRLLRLVTVVPQMRKVVLALISVVPGMASIAGLLTLFSTYSQLWPMVCTLKLSPNGLAR